MHTQILLALTDHTSHAQYRSLYYRQLEWVFWLVPLLDIVSWDGSRLHKLLARLQGSKIGSGPSNKSNPTVIQSVIGSSSDNRRYANNCMRVVTLSCNATAYNVDCEPIGLHRQLQQL